MKKSRNVISRVVAFARPKWLYLAGALLFALLSVAATLLVPVFTGVAVEAVAGKGAVDFSVVMQNIILVLITTAVAILFQYTMTLCANKAAYDTVFALRCRAFEKLNRVPLKFIDDSSRGDIIARVTTDTELISDGLIQGFTQLFGGVATVAGTLFFMLGINTRVSLIVVIITPVSVLVAWLIARGCHNMFGRQAAAQGEMSGLAEEMLGNIKLVKAFGYEARSERRFAEINGRIGRYGSRAVFYSALINPSTRLVNGAVYVSVCVVGALLALDPAAGFSIASLFVFLSYAQQYAKPFNEITGVITEIQTASAAAKRVFEILDEAEEEEESGKPALAGVTGALTAQDVKFSYTSRPFITGFNLEVSRGQRVALVGPTGCGKTTLINLFMRFYETDGGEIRIDGQDIMGYTRDSVRANIGMVLQDTWLFEGTIRQNIAYGKPDATLDEVIAAAKKARIHSYIARLDKGYDTVISETGNLSQGQQQLLCIARVMLTLPDMLILDEATSNIDTRTEIEIQKAFAAMMEGRTSLIVAHRLSTIKNADLILVMRDGTVMERGRHDELMARRGFYHELFTAQFSDV